MANAEVGSAYVTIMPAMDKSFGKTVEGAMGDAGKQGGAAMSGGLLGSFGGMAAKVIAALGVVEIVKKLGELTKAAVDAYADYEQLVGGVETLYGDAADSLMANAQRAYMTAGLSANQYMETTTSFAAALVGSLGGDTAEAARLADVAITDMADNANKMGTDMAAIQNAYQGFAKQNYTMLDNLKLGYGGTKTEMERLLADAEAISGIHYDIENYSDVVSAIHVIQEEMGIAGTTAEEAASTISGSWGMLQASWDNLLVSLAGGGDEISVAVQNVFESLFTWLGNVVPRIGETIRGIFEALPAAAEAAFPRVRDSVLGFMRETFGSDTTDMLLDWVNQFHGVFSDLTAKFDELRAVVEANVMPALQGVVDACAPIIEELVPKIIDVMGTVGGGVIDLATVVMGWVGNAVAFVTPILETLLQSVSSIFDGIKTTIEGVVQFVTSLVQLDFQGMADGVGTIFSGMRSTVESIWNGLRATAESVWGAIKSAIEGPINAARDAVGNAIDRIKGFFNFEFHWPHIPLPHFSISGSANPLDWLSGDLPSIGIEWYAKGGYVDNATLIGAGEKGGELIWPSYEPALSKYADAIARAGGAGTVNNYYIDGNLVNADARLAAALDVVAQRVGGRRRMGAV